jgi:hypothetical protein
MVLVPTFPGKYQVVGRVANPPSCNLGWTLLPYEADNFKWISERHGIDLSSTDEKEKHRRFQEFQPEFTMLEFTNWREEQQALNLIRTLLSLPAKAPFRVWCGNRQLAKRGAKDWVPWDTNSKRTGVICLSETLRHERLLN